MRRTTLVRAARTGSILALTCSAAALAQTGVRSGGAGAGSGDCPAADGADEIVVCGDRSARYRLPQGEGFDPAGDVASVSRERNALLGPGPGGIGSCSTVGPGGWTGCDLIRWRAAQQQRAGFGVEQPHALRVGRHLMVGAIKQ